MDQDPIPSASNLLEMIKALEKRVSSLEFVVSTQDLTDDSINMLQTVEGVQRESRLDRRIFSLHDMDSEGEFRPPTCPIPTCHVGHFSANETVPDSPANNIIARKIDQLILVSEQILLEMRRSNEMMSSNIPFNQRITYCSDMFPPKDTESNIEITEQIAIDLIKEKLNDENKQSEQDDQDVQEFIKFD